MPLSLKEDRRGGGGRKERRSASERLACQDKADELGVDLNWPYEGSQVISEGESQENSMTKKNRIKKKKERRRRTKIKKEKVKEVLV